jgi:type II secretory pathway component PulK
MKKASRHNGTVLLMVVFTIALISTIVVGIMQMSTEELMLMQNQLYAVQALTIAEAGLNDAFAQIRADSSWTTDASYTNKSFSNYGTYTVTLTGGPLPNRTITSEGTSAKGYKARVAADATISGTAPNFVIRVDHFRMNE